MFIAACGQARMGLQRRRLPPTMDRSLSFLWPHNLWLLLALPLLAGLYLALLRRRRRDVVTLSSLGLAWRAQGGAWRRHVAPALLLLALALALLAAARPTARLTLPWSTSTIMLAMDVSLSMRIPDVHPTRMVAAQEAAKNFLQELPRHVEVGIVTFAGSVQVAQQATLDRPSLVRAVDAIRMQLGTAVGSAIVVSLAELFPDHGIDLESMTLGPRRGARSLDAQERPSPRMIEPVAPGSFDAAAIIVLTDGRRTMGVDTLRAARMAADRGVRVHVVALGTPDGHLAMGEEMAIYLQLDEPTLREVAQLTGGEFHRAETAQALQGVYRDLGSRLSTRTRETEVGALLALAAALLVVAATALSLRWHGRVA